MVPAWSICGKHHILRSTTKFATLWKAVVRGCTEAQVDAKTVYERYGVMRYVTQQLQDQAGKHAGMMAAFCERMGWSDLEILIAKFQVQSYQEHADLQECPDPVTHVTLCF
jgi:hypothetical protein